MKITTELPERISVGNEDGRTDITAKVLNKGTGASGPVTLSVIGFEGLTVENVEGCAKIPGGRLPEGSNSGFACAVGDLAAGADRSFAVRAHFDLGRTGRICLPVTEGTSEKLLWQQGPVNFGTNNPTPNAPDTPLLLGTENVPFGPGGDGGTDGKDGEDGKGREDGGNGKDGHDRGELPRTGVSERATALGLFGVLLLAVGGAGAWWSTRRRGT
ncbi:LPXTG cell wall anchor domain-containing protein [Streptomyces sp. GC420]|uniref:LPXTG cell wall anchor domain-containing protein n=1 Tax=Streptomyces sp. GC420 TaxID=2697568 RepID=UPI001FB725CB|nr:LPXTG cell wall anchor domain-containing protein [Streptomyces sp. GC420]